MGSVIKSVLTAWKQTSAKQGGLLAAGVAFYAFTSLFPALIAAISIFGILSTPESAARQTEQLEDLLPDAAASIITDQLDQLVDASASSLGLSAVIAIALALWSASGGVNNLIVAINQMFSLADDRNMIQQRGLALAMTFGAIIFLIVAVGLLAVVPTVANLLDVVPGTRYLIEFGRWAILIAVVVGAVATLYRLAPNRPRSARFISGSVLFASVAWLVVSGGFSFYVTNFGNYQATYGALAGVIILLLWLWIGIYALLIGAALEAVNEEIVTPESVELEAEYFLDRTERIRIQQKVIDPLNEFIDEVDDVLLTRRINMMESESARETARRAQELIRSRKKSAN